MLEKDRPGKLFIGGLSIDITEDRLEKVFGIYGRITEVIVIRDKVHQQSRGFGFVTYENPQDAIDACKGLNQTELNGNTINVTEAVIKVNNTEMSASPRRGGFSTRGRGGPPSSGRRGAPPSRLSGSSGGGGYPSSRGRGGSLSRGREDSYERRETYDRGGRERSPLRRSPLLSRGPPPSRAPPIPSRAPPPSRDMGYLGGSRLDDLPPRRQSDFGPSDRRGYDSHSSGYPDTRGGYPAVRRDDYKPAPSSRDSRGLLDERLAMSRGFPRDPGPSSRPLPLSSRNDPPPSRDYPPRDYSPDRGLGRAPIRERGYPDRGEYSLYRDERKDTYDRPVVRDYGSRGDYPSRDMGREVGLRDPPSRDSYSTRDSYPPRDPLPSRRDFSNSREYGGGRSGGFSSRDDVRETSYRDSGAPRGYGVDTKPPHANSRGPSFSSRGPPPSDRRGEDRNGFSGSGRRPGGPPPKRNRLDDRAPRGRPPPMRR